MNTINLHITTTYDGNPPRIGNPNPAIIKHFGEEGFRALISRHYDLLAESKVKDLFPSHPRALEQAKNRSADFFIQRFGGPDYYRQNRGEPMMRKRHMPFKIDMEARIVWLQCYQIALKEQENIPEDVLLSFWNYLDQFSLWMINS